MGRSSQAVESPERDIWSFDISSRVPRCLAKNAERPNWCIFTPHTHTCNSQGKTFTQYLWTLRSVQPTCRPLFTKTCYTTLNPSSLHSLFTHLVTTILIVLHQVAANQKRGPLRIVTTKRSQGLQVATLCTFSPHQLGLLVIRIPVYM